MYRTGGGAPMLPRTYTPDCISPSIDESKSFSVYKAVKNPNAAEFSQFMTLYYDERQLHTCPTSSFGPQLYPMLEPIAT